MRYDEENATITVQGSTDDLNTLYQALALSDSKVERKKHHLYVTAPSDHTGLMQRIGNFGEQLGLDLTIKEMVTPVDPLIQSLQHQYSLASEYQGVRLHIPTKDEVQSAMQGDSSIPQDALQNTLITGRPGIGKTTVLMHAMADAGANPHIILIVLMEEREPSAWEAIKPNSVYGMDERAAAFSWVQGQINQRRGQPARTPHKPIVFVIDVMDAFYSYMTDPLMDLAMEGNEVGVYLYGTMLEQNLNEEYDEKYGDERMAKAFPRRIRLGDTSID